MPYWVLSGTPENWRIGLEKKIWGMNEKARGWWERIQPGDIVLFYATGNTGFLGEGIVLEKFIDETPLWPEEKEGKTSFKYRLKLKVEKLFDRPIKKPKWLRRIAFSANPISEDEYKKLVGK